MGWRYHYIVIVIIAESSLYNYYCIIIILIIVFFRKKVWKGNPPDDRERGPARATGAVERRRENSKAEKNSSKFNFLLQWVMAWQYLTLWKPGELKLTAPEYVRTGANTDCGTTLRD